jgi:hypothetical protein
MSDAVSSLGARTTHPTATGTARRILARLAPYPTLLGIAFVLEPAIGADVSPLALVRVLVIVAIMGLAVTLVATALLGRDRGAIAATIVIAGLAVASTPLKIAVFGAAIALLSVEAWLAARGALRIRVPWQFVTRFMNAALAILVAIQIAGGAFTRLNGPAVPAAGWSADAAVSTPDIYVLLADGHGRADVLRDAYGLSSTTLADALTPLGFVESPDSHANHARTRYSLSVLFNGRPLSELGEPEDGPIDERVPYVALTDASAFELLRTLGYEIVIISSGYEQVALRGAGTYLDVGPRNEAEDKLLEASAIGQVVNALTGGSTEATRERTIAELDAVRREAKSPADHPRFVFMHLPVPHLPFVFEADCSARPDDGYTTGPNARGYHAGDATSLAVTAAQTECVDSLLADTVGPLVAADPDAVVLVLSDHGPEDRLDWWDPSADGIADRMANLFWARTPGVANVFPADVSLVNVLPLLFNAYLGSDIPLHPNDLWFGPVIGGDRFAKYVPGIGSLSPV